jgi:hypothetical protein
MEGLGLSSTARCLVCLGCLLVVCLRAEAQVTAAAGIAPGRVGGNSGKMPRVPGVSTLLDGLNAGVTYSAVHNSASGWYSVATPGISYTVSSHFSADANASIYFHRMVENTNPLTMTLQPLVRDDVDAGDTLIGFHGIFEPGAFRETITGSLTAPTGNRAQGLGTGRVTYDFSNNLVRYYKKVGFLLDLGAGDSSALVNDLVMKDYNSLGGLAHFQTGAVIWLPGRTYVESVAYEQLPLGSQTIYKSVPRGDNVRRNDDDGPPVVPVTVSSVSEDNGFTTFVDIPLSNYVSLSGYYNRSLRHHGDTVSFGVTYVLRGTRRKKLSMIDRALREAEGANP